MAGILAHVLPRPGQPPLSTALLREPRASRKNVKTRPTDRAAMGTRVFAARGKTRVLLRSNVSKS
eukprot:7104081-Heterocapsa_arctica.AAC.1